MPEGNCLRKEMLKIAVQGMPGSNLGKEQPSLNKVV
jgi:hypothetical protein